MASILILVLLFLTFFCHSRSPDHFLLEISTELSTG